MAARKSTAPKAPASKATAPAKAEEVKATTTDATTTAEAKQPDAPITGAEASVTTATDDADGSAAATTETTNGDNAKAPEPKAPEKKEPETAAEPEGETKALFIKSRPATGFRRCGMRFTPEGHGVALELLTDDQVATLKADANLIVEVRTIPASA